MAITVQDLMNALEKVQNKDSYIRVPVYNKCTEGYIDQLVCNYDVDNDTDPNITLFVTN